MKYIPAEKLIAEIERRERFYERTCERLHQDDPEFSTSYAIASALKELRSFIISLQQEPPEVDLEKFDKDVTKIWCRCAAEPNDSITCFHIETFNEVARHFYELGLNAKKDR